MRSIFLILGSLFYVPASLISPAAGLLAWEWFSIMSPHRLVYGFAQGQPFNFVIAVATLLGWLFSAERKRFTPDALPWILVLWFAWMTVTTIAAPIPDIAWLYWGRVIRVLVPVCLVFMLLTNRARIHGMIWVLVISLGFYGIKGGAYTMAGHSGVIFGPPDTMIADNNALALAVVMQLPLVYYLWKNTRAGWLRAGLALAIPIEIMMVFSSHSRGGVIALSVMLGAFWLRIDRKILYGLIGAAIIASILAALPPEFWTRIDTLHNVSADTSFEGRVDAWVVAFHCAHDYFPFGAGFYTPQQPAIFNRYLPNVPFHAAHSIYFQVLGEHGYIGLAIYLFVLVWPLYNATLIVRRTRNNSELAWAHDLADMLRVALIGFYVGAAALSVTYFDGYLVLIALTSTLRELTAPKRVEGTLPRSAWRARVASSAANPRIACARGQLSRRYPNGPHSSAYNHRPDG